LNNLFERVQLPRRWLRHRYCW